MNTTAPFPRSSSRSFNPHASPLLLKGSHADTRLAFSPARGTFVQLKQYHRKGLDDPEASKELNRKLRSVQAQFRGGIAFPLAAGIRDGRVFQEMELLPGHSLLAFVRRNGRLPSHAILSLARRIVDRLVFVRDHYGFLPSLLPESIFLCREDREGWVPSFADYPLWPCHREAAGPEQEEEAVEQLAVVLYFLASRKIVSSFAALCQAWPVLRGTLPYPLLPIFDWFLREGGDSAGSLPAELCRQLAVAAAEAGTDAPILLEPRVESHLLESIPPIHRLESRFTIEGGGRCLSQPGSYDAHDQLRNEPRRIHLLPAEDITGNSFRRLIAQARKLTHRRPQCALLPVEDVLCDPAGCVISERHPQGISLEEVLERRPTMRTSEAAALLGRIGHGLLGLRMAGWDLRGLSAQDIFLDGAILRGDWNQRLLSSMEVRFRGFPSNVHFRSTRTLAGFLPQVPQAEQVQIARNWNKPQYWFFTLAATMLQDKSAEEPTWSRPARQALRHALLSRADCASQIMFLARLHWIARTQTEPVVSLRRSEVAAAA
jgi:hypothetical protein